MGRLLKLLAWVLVVGFLALVVYAMLSDLPAPTREITVPLAVPAAQ